MLIQYQYIEKNPEILEIQGKLISDDYKKILKKNWNKNPKKQTKKKNN